MTDLRNLLKGQTISSTTAANLETIGGRVFLDGSAVSSLNDLERIVTAWRNVHVPTYGAPIGGTGNVQSLTASEANTFEDVITCTGSQVTAVQFIGLFNADATTPATVDVALTDSDGTAYIASTLQVDPLTFANAFVLGSPPIYLDANVSLQFRVPSGPYASISIRTSAIDLVNA